MFQLFDLVEKSTKVFAANINNNNQALMYPNLISDGKTDFRNPFCEKNLIHVKFVKIRQSLLKPVMSCSDEIPNHVTKTAKEKNVIVERTSENRYVFCAMVYNVYPFVFYMLCFIRPKYNDLFFTFITLRFRCRCVSVFFSLHYLVL